jgi:ribonucleoside-diphosphate reductase alpha chain
MVDKIKEFHSFIGQTEEQRRNLENKIKKRYEVSDWNVDNEIHKGIGYKIYDKKNNKDIYFSPNSRLTLETRYLERDKKRKVTENVLDLFSKVAANVSEADLKYNPDKDIAPVAEDFLESLVYQEFMPNTPTLCNAGRSLQQLSACFVLPIEDYIATDDIGEDPEKQGNGIFDILRYMSMIHKSGGGTGFNFSHLRPRSDAISTTFGSSSGPVSFLRVYDSATDAVNQGGFRRGANMGILDYTHPDIFEFIGEKARNHNIINFNLSVGADKKFMDAVKNDGYFKLINPKDEKIKPLEERVWKKENLLMKGTEEYNRLFKEINPSLLVDWNGKEVINAYTDKIVGKVGKEGEILISAKTLFEEISRYAWEEGCPGIIFLDRIEANNKTPHIGKKEATNPCGEQPLMPFGACNLSGVNLATCVKDGEVDYGEIQRRVYKQVHFLDNVVDMSKFPFKKVYEIALGTREIGNGLMGWAEMLTQLRISYDSEEAVSLARKVSGFITDSAREKSIELAKERGVFPYWEGSEWEKENVRVRNATLTTIAPNGTTGMIADANGGIEPFFKLAYKKTCMDGKELPYIIPQFVKDLEKHFSGKDLEEILKEVREKGNIQDIDKVPEELKKIYKTSHDISPEWHVRMQAAFQSGIDNAVSKTVNLPNNATEEDVQRIYQMAYDEGCVGITIFRDGCKKGVYSGLEERAKNKEIELVQNDVKKHQILSIKPQAIKYKVKREENKDSLHIILDSDLYVDDKNKKAYLIPSEVFQNRSPLGHATTTSFSQAGIDRTEILKGPNPDYVELIARLQSAFSHEEEGIGPGKIKSVEHAVGVAFEDYFLRNGIIGRDKITNQLVNLVRKNELRHVKEDSEEYEELMKQVRARNSDDEQLVVIGNNGKLGHKFVCETCGSEEYLFEAGCNHPKCKSCGDVEGGGCG